MFERLLLLDATLKSIPPRAVAQLLEPGTAPPIRPEPAPRVRNRRHPDLDANRLLSTGLDLLASRRFVALEFVGGRRPAHCRCSVGWRRSPRWAPRSEPISRPASR